MRNLTARVLSDLQQKLKFDKIWRELVTDISTMSSRFEQIEQMPVHKGELRSPTTEGDPKIEIWGGVTDPEKHDPNKYRYLVHAFNPLATCSQPIIALSAQLSGIYQVDKREGDQSINLFDQPERLGERVSLSMSLIDEKHTGTWGPGGIIVEAPSECIVMTSPTDIGSHNSSREFLMKQARLLPLLSGDQLLQRTLPGFYNEVVAFGRSENGKTLRLKGFFIKVNKRGKPIDPVIAERMRQHVKRLNLPLVKIQVQGLYDQEMFSIEEYGVWAHYKGFRYNLGSKKPELAFQAYDGDNNNFFFSFPHRNRRGSSTLCEAWRSKLEASSRNYKRI